MARVSIANVPRILGPDAAAQDLDAAVTKTETEVGRMGVHSFWTPMRRELIMHLPTDSGESVLRQFVTGADTSKSIHDETQREAFLHALLHELVMERWHIDCRRLWFAVAPTEKMPEQVLAAQTPQEFATWYSSTYEEQASRDQKIKDDREDPSRWPGREYRQGKVEPEDGAPLYPPNDGALPRKSSARAGVPKGPASVRDGELYTHPGDTAKLWPGVSASHIVEKLPADLDGGCTIQTKDYNWVPLARRVDLDRVLNTMLEFPAMFSNVEATGEHNRRYKALAWMHMNPYHISFKIGPEDAGSQRSHGEGKLNG